ncbi:hypothetical protein DFH07DRAFT_314177 [Mycena maculata]|uniref:F-box domain-containing protein n=1 Tax=Mycena maculata TaxID=230809 RepID=A0AAD7HG64_9AGAR|nr:hypothetical protein DFH07DRAFT_314177 [Mycena maculata]
MSSLVPNELWLEVFENLPRDSLRQLSLTHTKFKGLSRTLLFAHLDFKPYAYTREGLMLPHQAGIDSRMQRLDFWASDEIAPLVRTCRLSPAYSAPMGSDYAVAESPYVLLEALFERFARFTRLERFSAASIRLTHMSVVGLCRVSPPSVLIFGGFLDYEEGIEQLPSLTQALNVSKFNFVRVRGACNLHRWIVLLNPNHLGALSLSYRRPFSDDIVHRLPLFPHLRKLALEVNPWDLHRIIPFLLKFPATQVFSIHVVGYSPADKETPLPAEGAGLFPILKEYIGPYQTLPIFLSRQSLLRIEVTRKPTSGHFVAQLREQLQTPSNANVTSLDVDFEDLTHHDLGVICAFFPQLAELKIEVSTPFVEATSFFRLFAENPILPPGMEHFAISWRFSHAAGDPYYSPDNQGAEMPDLPMLRDALVDRCPGIRTIWILRDNILLKWRSSSGEEGITTNIAHEDTTVESSEPSGG